MHNHLSEHHIYWTINSDTETYLVTHNTQQGKYETALCLIQNHDYN